jgi:hypothetical protein
VFALFLQDIWKVLLYSLLLGAGLPVLYAVGVRASAFGTVDSDGTAAGTSGTTAATPAVRRRRALGRTAATLCFLVVLCGIALGLAYIVAAGHGEQLSFEHGYPTFVPKS